MTDHTKALEAFDELYSLRTLRDTAWHVANSVRRQGDADAAEAFTSQSIEYNRLSNGALVRLYDLGYAASRDEANDYRATLYHNGEAIAIWHGFGEVEALRS